MHIALCILILKEKKRTLCKLYGELKKFIIVNNDDRLILMSDEFICPECGSKEAGNHMMVSREPPTEKNKKDPWASILQQTECASCKNIIPDHLGDRWDNMSIEEAQKEWKETYRKTSRFQKL